MSHLNVSLTVRGKVTRPQTTTFEEKGEPKQRIKLTPSAYQPDILLLGLTGSPWNRSRGDLVVPHLGNS